MGAFVQLLFTAFCQAITVYSFQSLNRDERSIIRSDGVSPKPIDRRGNIEAWEPGNICASISLKALHKLLGNV